MIPGSFEYHRPASVAEAVKLLASLGDDAALVAGGHSLIPMMKLRLAVPEHLIDLRDIGDLGGIGVTGGEVRLGALVTQAELVASGELAKACPLIRETALQIGDPQVREMGTIGGNVANGDPGNDMPAVMQALDARFELTGPNGTRETPARGFYEAPFVTARAPDEVLTAIRFAAPPAGHGWSYMKQKRKTGDYATAAAAVLLTMNGTTCASAAVALTNVGDTPLLAEAAASALVGSDLGADAVARAVEAAKAITSPATDGRGPADFRTQVAGVMVARAIAAAASRTR